MEHIKNILQDDNFNRAELDTLKTREVFMNYECKITVLETKVFPENEEEKEWLAKQNFKNTADEIQNCYANKFSKNLVQERHDQRVIIKSYRQCMATAGCFSELGFIYMILLWR